MIWISGADSLRRTSTSAGLTLPDEPWSRNWNGWGEGVHSDDRQRMSIHILSSFHSASSTKCNTVCAVRWDISLDTKSRRSPVLAIKRVRGYVGRAFRNPPTRQTGNRFRQRLSGSLSRTSQRNPRTRLDRQYGGLRDLDPAKCPIRTAQTVLHFVRLAGVKRGQICIDTPLTIVGMDSLPPPIPQSCSRFVR